MRHDLSRLKELNSHLKPDATSLVVPIIPTLAMMEAAADTCDVFRPGDRLGGWLLPEAEVSEGVELVDPALAAGHGKQRAFELHVMAEAWAGCISGLREWSRKRGIEGSTTFIDGWFRPELDRCPAQGWPQDRNGVDDSHRSLLSERAGLAPFTHDEMRIPHADLAFVMPAPARCASIMAMRGGQREFLMEYYLIGLDDVIAMDRLPFIPGYTIEHRFDDEERHRILAAAAWRAAAAAVRSIEDEEKSEAMPLPPRAASVYLTRLAEHVPGVSRRVGNFFRDAPYGGITFSTDTATLALKSRGPVLDVRHERRDGRSMQASGWDFRLPATSDLLMNVVREMVSESGAEIDVKLSTDPS
jgi:hypothetical protein